MKTVPAPLRTHLDQTVTTLATLIKIVREDEEEFFLTDHDVDIVYDGDTYRCVEGYDRTAIQSTANLAVDNLDFATTENTYITRDDVRAGLFDHATAYLYLVNWASPSDGVIKLRKGKFGDLSSSLRGRVSGEFRGLAQAYQTNILRPYLPTCPHDLGDPATCKFPIYPDVLGRNQAVTVGQHYRVATKSTSGITWPNLVQNPGFEIDAEAAPALSITGWDIVVGNWALDSAHEGVTPHSGALFLRPNSGANKELRQDIDLVGAGVSATNIDAGHVDLDFDIWRAHSGFADQSQVIVECLDTDGAVLSTAYDSGMGAVTPYDQWKSYATPSPVTLTSGTRYIRIRLKSGPTLMAPSQCFDDLTLEIADSATTNSYQEIYENRIYEVVTAGTTAGAQPVYDETPGNDTTDGTAVLRCENAMMRHAWVETVIDQKTFAIIVDESRGVDGWFQYGGLRFEAGENTFETSEVKKWTQAGNKVELYTEVYWTICPGQPLMLYAGCDKSLISPEWPGTGFVYGDCKDKFDNTINNGSFLHMPGEDMIKPVDVILFAPRWYESQDWWDPWGGGWGVP